MPTAPEGYILRYHPASGRYYRTKVSPLAAPTIPARDRYFETAYAGLRPKLVRWARAEVRRPEDAEDIAQDVLLKIFMVVRDGRVDVNPEAHAYHVMRDQISAFWNQRYVRQPNGERVRRFVAFNEIAHEKVTWK